MDKRVILVSLQGATITLGPPYLNQKAIGHLFGIPESKFSEIILLDPSGEEEPCNNDGTFLSLSSQKHYTVITEEDTDPEKPDPVFTFEEKVKHVMEVEERRKK